MEELTDNEQPSLQERKTYETPQLIHYGHITELTQNKGVTRADEGINRKTGA